MSMTRIACFGPLPPEPTGIADYTADLLPALATQVDVTLFVDQATVDRDRLPASVTVRSATTFRGILAESFDMCIYQMGNNLRYHVGVYEYLMRYPGVTVLHDLHVHDFSLHWAGRQPCPRAALARELGYAYGVRGVRYGAELLAGRGAMLGQQFPLFERILDRSLGVIVHSRYAQARLQRSRPTARVVHISQPMPLLPAPPAVAELRRRLGYQVGDLVLGTFGYGAPTKHVHSVLAQLPTLREQIPNLHLVVAGEVVEDYPIPQMAADLGVSDIVRVTGYLDRETFDAYLHAVDIGINLRYPTNGETSASLLRLLSAGKPVVVAATDAFAELPDPICWKIDPHAGLAPQLAHAILALAGDEVMRRRMGAAALAYIGAQADPQMVAGQYLDFVEGLLVGVSTSKL